MMESLVGLTMNQFYFESDHVLAMLEHSHDCVSRCVANSGSFCQITSFNHHAVRYPVFYFKINACVPGIVLKAVCPSCIAWSPLQPVTFQFLCFVRNYGSLVHISLPNSFNVRPQRANGSCELNVLLVLIKWSFHSVLLVYTPVVEILYIFKTNHLYLTT